MARELRRVVSIGQPVIVVTGGAGYIGSQFVRDLGESGSTQTGTIRILDNLHRETFSSMSKLPESGRYQFVEGDILDSATVRRVLEDADTVVHLAALVKTPFSFDHPTWTGHVNHWGTARLLETCLESGVRRFIFASSCSVYGPGEGFSENDDCKPVGPYSESKRKAEKAVLSAGKRGLDITVLRLGTVFGFAPAIRFHAVPNRLAYLASIGRPVTIHGDGTQVRPVLHVDDASSAVLHVLEDKAPADTYNVASGNISIRKIADVIKAVRPFIDVRHTAEDFMSRFSLSVDAQKLRSTGWSCRYSLEDGMEEILERLGYFEPMGRTTEEVGGI